MKPNKIRFWIVPYLFSSFGVFVYSEETKAYKIPEKVQKPFPQYLHEEIDIPAASSTEKIRPEFSFAKAGEYLEKGALAWARKRKCVSCHTTGAYMQVRPVLSKVLGAPDGEIKDQMLMGLRHFKDMDGSQRREGANPAQIVQIALGLSEWDKHVGGKLSTPTKEALNLMFGIQDEDGTWGSVTTWPPLESSKYQVANAAAMAAATAPGWLKESQDSKPRKNFDLLTDYLRNTPPPHDYGSVLLLWTAGRIPTLLSPEEKKNIVEMIEGFQRPDGGWSIRSFAKPEEWGEGNRAGKIRNESDFANPVSDGHMTGLALLTLIDAGVEKEKTSIRKGVSWLKSNQRESGRWWTRSLNTDKRHFITYSGTAYPLLALYKCNAL